MKYFNGNAEKEEAEKEDRAKAERILREKHMKMTAPDIASFYGISVANFYSAINRYDLHGGQKCPMWAIQQILGKVFS